MGDPTPLGKIRDDSRSMYDKGHKDKIAYTLTLSALHHDRPLLQGPLHLDIHFYMPIPGTKKNEYKIDTPCFTYPKLTELIQYVERCATGTICHDDCNITSFTATKRYSNKPRTEFTFITIEDKKWLQ